eukprot:scaffold607_cov317-Alexandrium_tamarense.AAC.2
MNAAASSLALLSRTSLPNILRQRASISTLSRAAVASPSSAPSTLSTRRHHSTSLLLSSPRTPSSSILSNPSLHQLHHHQQQQKRSLFIQTATTPNPESLKFIPNGRLVIGHNSESGEDTVNPEHGEVELDTTKNSNNTPNENNTDTAGFYVTRKDHTLIARSPLAKQLFNLDIGIKSLYLGYDFITVTKFAEAHWQHLQTPIFGAIMDFYASGKPALRGEPEITDTTILEDDDEVVAMIKELLESRIRPAVQEDGGDIRYVGFEEETGLVTVQLAGSCVGCPSSSVTLKN